MLFVIEDMSVCRILCKRNCRQINIAYCTKLLIFPFCSFFLLRPYYLIALPCSANQDVIMAHVDTEHN